MLNIEYEANKLSEDKGTDQSIQETGCTNNEQINSLCLFDFHPNLFSSLNRRNVRG